MEKAKHKNLICFFAACCIVAILLYFWFQSVDAEMTDSYQVVALGDSIIGRERGESGIHAYVEELTGLTMYNGAFGGNCASAGEDAGRYSFHEESLNLYSLTESICDKDFRVQRADLAANQVKIDYFNEVLQGLRKIDFNKVDIVLLEFGLNDYAFGRKTDNPDDPYDVHTYGGALRYSIERLQGTYPELKLVLVTPSYFMISGKYYCTEKDYGGGTIDEYLELEKEIAEEYGLDFIDAFSECGIDKSNVLSYTEDSTHLNSEGRRIYGTFLAEKIKELSK